MFGKRGSEYNRKTRDDAAAANAKPPENENECMHCAYVAMESYPNIYSISK